MLIRKLLQGQVGLADFEPDAIARPEVCALFDLITKEPIDKLESEFPTEVIIRTHSGETFQAQIAMPVGSRQVPLTRAQMFEKLEDCCAQASGWLADGALRDQLQTLDRSAKILTLAQHLKSTKPDPIA